MSRPLRTTFMINIVQLELKLKV